ncbi:MAG: hypothetical protein H0U60_06445 [Blastocatellia bacterium]|nr:hypothetical protein [Blastocatellia bacterium]
MASGVGHEVIQALEKIIKRHENEWREWDTSQDGCVVAELETYLDDHPVTQNNRKLAIAIVAQYCKSRKIGSSKQGRLFDPEGILTLGDTRVVRAGDARPAHLRKHISVLTREKLVSDRAYVETVDELNEVLDKFQSEKETWLIVETRDFGWIDEGDDSDRAED